MNTRMQKKLHILNFYVLGKGWGTIFFYTIWLNFPSQVFLNYLSACIFMSVGCDGFSLFPLYNFESWSAHLLKRHIHELLNLIY